MGTMSDSVSSMRKYFDGMVQLEYRDSTANSLGCSSTTRNSLRCRSTTLYGGVSLGGSNKNTGMVQLLDGEDIEVQCVGGGNACDGQWGQGDGQWGQGDGK